MARVLASTLVPQKCAWACGFQMDPLTLSRCRHGSHSQPPGDWLASQPSCKCPATTVYGLKQLLGRKFRDPFVQAAMARWPFQVICDENDTPLVCVRQDAQEKRWLAEEIVAILLTELMKKASKRWGVVIHNAVITVPVSFTIAQRQAMHQAAALAGLHVLRLVHEPSAAAISYTVSQLAGTATALSKVVVVDMGSSGCNVSLMKIEAGILEVKAAVGDPLLGGDAFVDAFIKYLDSETSSATDMGKIREACQNAVRGLSSSAVTAAAQVLVEPLSHSPFFFECHLGRHKYLQMCQEITFCVTQLIDQVLRDGHLSNDQIDHFVLAGGATQLHCLHTPLNDQYATANPLHQLSVESAVVGATIWAGVLGGESSPQPRAEEEDLLLLDVTPHSLGVVVAGHEMVTIVIPRNKTTPTKKTVAMTLPSESAVAANASVVVRILEGEAPVATENTMLGEFLLPPVMQQENGEPTEIEVTFEVDNNLVLKVRVEEKSRHPQQQTTRKRSTPPQEAEEEQKDDRGRGGRQGSSAKKRTTRSTAKIVKEEV